MSLKYRIAPGEDYAHGSGGSRRKKRVTRIIESHNWLSALIVEMAQIERDGEITKYDGFWEDSLIASASEGIPDAEIIGAESQAHMNRGNT